MNTKLFVLAFAALVASANAEADCPPEELIKLAPLAGSPSLTPCQDNSAGFSFFTPKGQPTPEQTAKMCAFPQCHDLIKDVIALNPSDCLTFKVLNIQKLVNGFEASCAALSPAPAPAPTPAVTPAPATKTPGTDPAPAPATPSTSPVPATSRPGC